MIAMFLVILILVASGVLGIALGERVARNGAPLWFIFASAAAWGFAVYAILTLLGVH